MRVHEQMSEPSFVVTGEHFTPAYIQLHSRGWLLERARLARQLLSPCRLCGRRCSVDRLAGERGACRIGEMARVASYGPHFGEERPLVGIGGSGTIFFSGCNLRCIFCQNYDISHGLEGEDVGPAELATMMLRLQELGCHNINLVSPTHVVPQILMALAIAAEAGLRLPLVYNTGGYDSPETIRLLEGIIDIYMPDAKYSSSAIAEALSGVKCYPAVNRAMIREAYRQVGHLVMDRHGVAVRGLLVRHLVLPEGLAGTPAVMAFLAKEVSVHTYVNTMDQYRPCFQAGRDSRLQRRITQQEYTEALQAARAHGLYRLDGFWLPAGSFR